MSRISCCPSEHVLTVEHVVYHFFDGVGDEDEGDEAGEALLCEAGHVFYDVAGVREHQDKTLQTGMKADPQTQLHVVDTVEPARRGLSVHTFPSSSVCAVLLLSLTC